MEIIRLEEAKEYCDKHNVERNAWVAGAIDRVLAGTHAIQYNKDNFLALIDLRYLHSHMQSLGGFDRAFDVVMNTKNFVALDSLKKKQAMLTIGELADDFEIGIA